MMLSQHDKALIEQLKKHEKTNFKVLRAWSEKLVLGCLWPIGLGKSMPKTRGCGMFWKEKYGKVTKNWQLPVPRIVLTHWVLGSLHQPWEMRPQGAAVLRCAFLCEPSCGGLVCWCEDPKKIRKFPVYRKLGMEVC